MSNRPNLIPDAVSWFMAKLTFNGGLDSGKVAPLWRVIWLIKTLANHFINISYYLFLDILTYISTYSGQFSWINASNLPSEQLFYRLERITALCRRQGHVQNRFGHFDLNGHVLYCFSKTSSWSYRHFETAVWAFTKLNTVSHINRNLNRTFEKKNGIFYFICNQII